MVPNSLTNQRQIIVSSFGFNSLHATLLGCVDGVVTISTTLVGVWLAARFPNSRCYVAVAFTIPNIIAVFDINLLPWSNKIGLLFSQWTSGNSVLFGEIIYTTDNRKRFGCQLCSITVMGLQRDGWSYKASYGECDYLLRILRWKCRRPLYVASQILPKVLSFFHLLYDELNLILLVEIMSPG